MAENFLQRLARNPYAPIDGASVTRVDELGNGYDDFGQLIAPKFEQPQQTWGETALGVATAPARMATALAGSLSPYGQDGWQVPPIVSEGVDALTAVGDAYSGKLESEDINSRALGMAGFMMGGGGLAARPAAAAGRASVGRYAQPLEDITYPPAYGTTKGQWRAGGFTDEPWQNPFPGHARPVQDPETGGMLWPYDLTERATQRAGDVRGFPDLYSNASKEGGLLSNILGYFQGNKEPVTVRGYHGTRSEFDKFNGPSVYASENPDAASEWAMVANRDGEAPNVLPLDITASNPYYAKSLFPDQAELDRIAAADPDVVFYPPSTQYGTTFDKYPGQVFEARKPGTVRSATTGETLFSNADSKPALLGAGQEQDIPDWLLPYLR